MVTRREFLRASLASAVSFLLAACRVRVAEEAAPATSVQSPSAPPASTQAAQSLPPTPACGADDGPTLAQTEGPFFTPNSPERISLLEPGITGVGITLSGQVLSTACVPIAGALVDFWHADDAGVYDNAGYKLRGHQFADAQGRYELQTIVPGLYPGRTRHFHVKAQAPNHPVLTTQLYFPDEPRNEADGIFRPELLMEVQDTDGGKLATFNFVLDLG